MGKKVITFTFFYSLFFKNKQEGGFDEKQRSMIKMIKIAQMRKMEFRVFDHLYVFLRNGLESLGFIGESTKMSSSMSRRCFKTPMPLKIKFSGRKIEKWGFGFLIITFLPARFRCLKTI